MTFNEILWGSYSIEELRNIAFSGKHLEADRKKAIKEMIERTTNFKIDDLQRGSDAPA